MPLPNFDELFPDQLTPNTGPGVSYCISPNARMFDYELVLPGERCMRGCIRAVDQKDAERILQNRHPSATIRSIGKGQRIIAAGKKT
jgi:hypothetical protein